MSDEPINESDPGATTEAQQPSRRDWLLISTIASGAIATVLLVIPVVGYVLGALFQKRKSIEDRKIKLDEVENFVQGKTRYVTFRNPLSRPWDGATGDVAVYVKRASKEEKDLENLNEHDEFTVFAVNCTHLGCPVSWFEQAGLFLCPCHGGAYYSNGDKASGPPPSGLFKYAHKIEKGKLYIVAGHLPTLSNPATEGES